MHPLVGSIPAYVIGWGIAALLGGGSFMWLMWREGMRAWQIAVAFMVIAVSMFAGSKVLYVFEMRPQWVGDPGAFWDAVLSTHMRIPGGFLLAIAVGPSLTRAIGVRYARFTDAVTPAGGLCIVGIRIGCFMQGCCYGRPSSLPWAVTFPGAAEAVHPLQLYFGATGLLIFGALTWYQSRKRYDGEIILLFALIFLWSTWWLESLRGGYTHEYTRHLVLTAALAVTAGVPVIEWRLWAVRRRVAKTIHSAVLG